eukprot:TRINITY_DN26715_c0_g1_i1.p1 TRINITY_DN26715_c0_g1~~TRINITY_DN26715_c0_g1_i1.p1  ORF type:complete len:756 (+),score=115.85 TRINITY_DN26715_c0_g1_i1:100-2367(+)
MGYRVGEQAGPYEVLELLGRGTFGEVLLARDLRRQKFHVALKTVSCEPLTGEAGDRMQDATAGEAELLMRLKHPHIVRCFETQLDKERHVVWLALELMDGGDVQSLIDSRRQADEAPFEPQFVRRVLACVGSALQYVHGEGVLHRDVKPANILVARRSHRIKLGDFGISKLLEATGRAHTMVGTPYYLSPEIVSGQGYGCAADAWALGVCLFELAALQRPFEAANALALVRRICEEPPLDLPAGTMPDICTAIAGLLERDPCCRLTLTQALAVSDAVAALACDGAHEPSQATSPTRSHALCSSTFNDDLTLPLGPPCSQDVSPVSMATPVSGYGSSPNEAGGAADIVASLTGAIHCTGIQNWQGLEAMAHAKAALSADVDDPEELQLALQALEQDGPQPGEPMYEAFEALSYELRLRIAALRADAAALLQSLLDATALHADGLESTPFPCPPQWVPIDQDAPDTVTTMCMEADEEQSEDVAALETAIELASSLGVDTGAAEEHAAFARGLLSLRVSWGSTACFMLLPSGMPFYKVCEVVARRFGFMEGELGTQRGARVFELWYREGSEFHRVRDEATWETCLYHARSQQCRVELCLETVAGVHPPLRRCVRRGTPPCQSPFMVTGTRLSTPCDMHGEAGEPLPFVANGGFRSVPLSWRGQPARKAQARRSPRPPLPSARDRHQQPCLHGSTGLAVSGGRLAGMATRQPTSARKSASRGGAVAPLELGGRTPRRGSAFASLSVLGSSPQRPHYAGA